MKYKLQTRIGQLVTKIEINIRSESDRYDISTIDEEGLHITPLKIAYQTERRIALNDKWITTIDRQHGEDKKSSHWTYLEDVTVAIRVNNTLFANGVFGRIYTLGDAEKAIKKLTKAMQEKVNKKYGFLFNIDIESKVNEFKN